MALKYKVGDRIRIKSLDWYNENKSGRGFICFEYANFIPEMFRYCGEILTISQVVEESKHYLVSECAFAWTDEMIEGLVEEGTKPKFKIGDRVMARDMSGIWEITNVEDDILYTIKREDHTFTLTTYGSFLTLYEGISDKKEEMKSENSLLNEYEELTDRAFKGGYEKCKSDIELNGFQIPDGYVFKDENGNVINATKIVLEKKKKEYPKTYEECCKVLGYDDRETYCICHTCANERLFESLYRLKVCRDAYWKIAGEEMKLGKPWKPDFKKDFGKWSIECVRNKIEKGFRTSTNCILTFPTEEMRDAFYENFKELIEECKELL